MQSIGVILVSKLFAFSKFSLAVGTFWTSFSLRAMLTPLVGAFGGALGISLLASSTLAQMLFFKKALSLSFLAFSGIPSIAASLYWAFESRVARIIIPAFCMVLFIAHPEGMYAAPYALYWLIPIGVAYFSYESIFLLALGSTFTAHAVGSVLWLYATHMQAGYWYGLLPLVPAERLLLASGMAVSYYAFSYCYSLADHFFVHRVRA